VILLEGRREIPPEFALRAKATGGFLASRFPSASFRSDNASGSDEVFSAGVAEVDPTRLHIVTPSPNHRMRARLAGAVFDSLTDLSEAQRLLLSFKLVSWQKHGRKNRGDLRRKDALHGL
jgi:hypothetical protein